MSVLPTERSTGFVLPSYVGGRWTAPGDDGRPCHDAVTGDEICRLSTAGVDMAAVADHGRRVGGPALRALTFHERAALLKELTAFLRGHADELYAVSDRTGATRADSRIDVDGGIAAVASYASRGRQRLPAGRLWLVGDHEPLGTRDRFLGEHVLASRLGLAVQVNAYNFPCWLALEKFAPAFLAGVPSVIKPGSSTAYLTEALVRLMLGSGLLPEGSLQFLAGSVGDLFDHLAEQDDVSVSGSSATARRIRAHPSLIASGARLTTQADSLDCSILGPDAVPGTPEFDLYVAQLATEMTIKAGQRSTAIRRALVPAAQVPDVLEAVEDLLGDVVVGAPADPEVTMGALAGVERRDAVRRSLADLAGAARVVCGDPERVEVRGADPERGAFLAPVLLAATDPRAVAVHEVEAFGPVATVIGYDGPDDAVDLAARGRGSLTGSVVTADADFAREVVMGCAPWHGRLLVLDRAAATDSTGHGAALPPMAHGGPGRAGGGEELGGLRAVANHMQRVALQGSPDMLTAITGRWLPGSARRVLVTHPYRKPLEQLRVGDTAIGGPRRVTQADVEHFAEFTGDTFYAHTDAAAAQDNPLFGGRVAQGYLVVSIAAGLFTDPEPGPVLGEIGIDHLRFVRPVRFDDELTITLTVKQIHPRSTVPYGEVRWDADVMNQRGETVARYDLLTLVSKESP